MSAGNLEPEVVIMSWMTAPFSDLELLLQSLEREVQVPQTCGPHVLDHELVRTPLDVHVHGSEGGDLHVLLGLEFHPLTGMCEKDGAYLAAGILECEVVMAGRVLFEVGYLTVYPQVPDSRRVPQDGLHSGVQLCYSDRFRHAAVITGCIFKRNQGR